MKKKMRVPPWALYLTMESEDDSWALQNDLEMLSARETRWDMEFNPSKCQVVHVIVSKETTYNMDSFGVCSMCQVSRKGRRAGK